MSMYVRPVVSVALALFSLSAVACSASPDDAIGQTSAAQTASSNPSYLALGDSIAFGEDGWIPWTTPGTDAGYPERANASQFVGYPSYVASKRLGSMSDVTNLGCPGETTGSFFDATAPDNGCRQYKSFGGGNGAWLHTPYAGTQMQAALAYLAANKVSLITIDLGGNDLLLTQDGCSTAANFDTCVVEAMPGVIETAVKNISTIMDSLHGAGYRGRIVYLTQYATSYTDITQDAAIPPFNAAVGAAVLAHGGLVASGFDTFAGASLLSGGSPCNAGLLIPNPDGGAAQGCNMHPSAKGAKDLAEAVTILTY
jgi:hypothetical protein